MKGATGNNMRQPTPRTLAEWRQCAAGLVSKQGEIEVERASLAGQRQELALAAATGDKQAQMRIAQVAVQEHALEFDRATIAEGLVRAGEEIAAGEARLATSARQQAVARHGDLLEKRLVLVEAIEQAVRSVAPQLTALAELTLEIEGSHAQLGGSRATLPPLAQENVGGRLAEFMAGQGFAAWLPLARPEVRPALGSWIAAEKDAQTHYRLTV
ncbi:hypothetical protein [Dongia sp.]|uniref:hypothetical protein n=1 Tax=Dongia sp. TaxID=1977262 RepID=UPI0035AFF583